MQLDRQTDRQAGRQSEKLEACKQADVGLPSFPELTQRHNHPYPYPKTQSRADPSETGPVWGEGVERSGDERRLGMQNCRVRIRSDP